MAQQFAFRPDMATDVQPVQGMDPRSIGSFGVPQLPKAPPQVNSTPPEPDPSAPSRYSVRPEDSSDPRGLTPFIRQTAMRYGVDPDVAIRVAGSEGLSNPLGDKGTSFGGFQLHTGGGMGDEFRRDTGLDPADPKNERATIDYALFRASKEGWGAWHGAKRVGIGQFEGIPLRDVYARK